MPKVLQRHFCENLTEEQENFTSPESKCCLIVSHLLFPPMSLCQTIINRGADSILVTKPDCNVIVNCVYNHCVASTAKALGWFKIISVASFKVSDIFCCWIQICFCHWCGWKLSDGPGERCFYWHLLFPCVPPFQHFLIILGRYHKDIKGRVKTLTYHSQCPVFTSLFSHFPRWTCWKLITDVSVTHNTITNTIQIITHLLNLKLS